MSERRSTWARFLFLFNYGSLVAFWQSCQDGCQDGWQFANSTERVIKLWNIESLERVVVSHADGRTGSGRLPAIYFANCKSWNGQVPFRSCFSSRRRSWNVVRSARPHNRVVSYATSCRAHNSPTASFINSIPNVVAQLVSSSKTLSLSLSLYALNSFVYILLVPS